MFNWFRSKASPRTALDASIQAAYGNNAKRTANPTDAVNLVNIELLRGSFRLNEIVNLAADLARGPVPYSTHDLAVSVALGLLKKVPPESRMPLMEVQMAARLTVANWAKEGKVVPALAEAFEHTLYKDYHPAHLPKQTPFPDAHIIRGKIAGLVQSALSDRSTLLELVKPNCAIVLDTKGGVSLRWLSITDPDADNDIFSFALLRQLSAFKLLLETCAQEAKTGTLDDAFFFGPGRMLFDRLAIEALSEMERFLEQVRAQRQSKSTGA